MMEVRANLSSHHIQAAALFARQSYGIESEYGGKTLEQLRGTGVVEDSEACVLGTVFSSVAFLEAAINELFNDVAGGFETTPFKQLGAGDRDMMAGLWKLGVDRFSTLNKFQAALTTAGKQQFDRGAYFYQDADNLIKLRNRLIHYEPELIPVGTDTGHNLEKRLNGKFPLNPWYRDKGNPFYPHKCLGHRCAEWAVSSSLRFADEFSNRMGITLTYDSSRPRLNTK